MNNQGSHVAGFGRRAATTRTVALNDLLQGGRDVIIAYGERRYRLRITRQDKVILTKDELSSPDGSAAAALTRRKL